MATERRGRDRCRFKAKLRVQQDPPRVSTGKSMTLYELIQRLHKNRVYRYLNVAVTRVLGEGRKQSILYKSILKFRAKRSLQYATKWDANCKALAATVLRHATPVTQPLLLISEVQRSGGSLLTQLFDMHPQCHVHPHELKTGCPEKHNWPELDLAGESEQWFYRLFEHDSVRFLEQGYKKDDKDSETHQFTLLPALQRELFLKQLRDRHKLTYRDIFNTYMTSYFNAWLNNRNLQGDKRWVVGFTPMFAVSPQNVERHFATYPDGMLLSLLRHPVQWYDSARRHRDKYRDSSFAMDRWCESAMSMLRNRETHPDRVLLVNFEDLLGKTRETTRLICRHLDIEWHETMLVPTFNGTAIVSNSSFSSCKGQVSQDVLARTPQLTAEDRAYVEARGLELYEQVLAHCLRID